MTDYRAEQTDEIEAIQSIYSEEIDIISENPHRSLAYFLAPWLSLPSCYRRFTIPVKTEDYDEEEGGGEGRWVLLKFTFPAKYPDEVPEMEIEEEENVEGDMKAEMMVRLGQVAEENLGMAMVFTIVSEGIQWLAETNDRIKEEKEAKIKAKKDADDAEEQRKLEGTKVTMESFLGWKTEFDKELQLKKGKEAILAAKKKGAKKTGRELFLTDSSLIDSDVKFLAEAGDTAVAVDESLFEDLEDLDMEGDDSDDPDWDGQESDD